VIGYVVRRRLKMRWNISICLDCKCDTYTYQGFLQGQISIIRVIVRNKSYVREHLPGYSVGILPMKGQIRPKRTLMINTRVSRTMCTHTGFPVQGSGLFGLLQCIYYTHAVEFRNSKTGLTNTHNPLGWMSTILSFTLIPTSFIQPLTRSRSFVSGQLTP
jgi:hypothetical protein